MTAENISANVPEQVSCEICRSEIPVSEANIAEAVDYVVHFCGVECYEEWKKEEPKTEDK